MPYRVRKSSCRRSDGKKGKYVLEYIPKGKRKYKRAGCHTSQKKAHGQRAAIEGGPRESFERDLQSLLETIDRYLLERAAPKDDSGHLKQYDAPEGSSRDIGLDKAQELYDKGDIEAAVKVREDMEEKERNKKDFKNKSRPDTKKESIDEIDRLIMEIISEAKSSGGLSEKTKETLRKKAKERGLTPGSVFAEYRKGLAAWVSSGSRKGMSQHQWAMARVNSATPSKSWATVKKSKAKKK